MDELESLSLIEAERYIPAGIDDEERAALALSIGIAIKAHQKQYRPNGEPYYYHPLRCAETFQNLIGLGRTNGVPFEPDDLAKANIPFKGILPLCWLHDVVEDTDITFDDVADIFAKSNLKVYFCKHIAKPLELLTHRKGEGYEAYIERVEQDARASLVKILDMHNNLLVLTAGKEQKKYNPKSHGYLDYSYRLDDEHHFSERFEYYSRLRYLQDDS